MPKLRKVNELLREKLAPPLKKKDAAAFAEFLKRQSGLDIYPASIAISDGTGICIGVKKTEKFLVVFEDTLGFRGKKIGSSEVLICKMTHRHAMLVREIFPFTAPVTVGLKPSFGAGDRLGLAAPGHIMALKNSGVFPVLAQQSIREMQRTGRTPEQVMDAATWGVLQAGYRGGFGSDADHLKTYKDVDITAAAGFTMFTIDPKSHVDDGADDYDYKILDEKVRALPWNSLGESIDYNIRRYVGKPVKLPNGLVISAPTYEQWQRAAVKYARAVLHTSRMKKRIEKAKAGDPWELEMSVDETDSPTTVFEHYYVASELKRFGVKPVSLAPRFIGDFEKGVDYKGDLKKFEKSLKYHIGIARLMGPYKLSFHSGSDKFSIYPIAAKVCGDLVHVKTAGTSYLEAVRAIATIRPGLFKKIVRFAHERYDIDKATYHVSAKKENAPTPAQLKKGQYPKALDQFDLRQMLHVTFGSVLTTKDEDGNFLFYDDFIKALKIREDVHYKVLARHIRRHVKPFSDALKKKPGKKKTKKK